MPDKIVKLEQEKTVEFDDIYPEGMSEQHDAPLHWNQPCRQAQMYCPQLNRRCMVHACAALRTGMLIGRDARDHPRSPTYLPLVYCGLAHPNDPAVSETRSHGGCGQLDNTDPENPVDPMGQVPYGCFELDDYPGMRFETFGVVQPVETDKSG